MVKCSIVISRLLPTVNPEILARILFSRIAFKDLLAMLKFATRA